MVYRKIKRITYRTHRRYGGKARLYRTVKKIVKATEGEIKHYNFPLLANYGTITSSNNTTWNESLLSYIANGNADGQRIGSKINLMGWKMDAVLMSGYTGAVGSDSYDNLRMVIAEYDLGNTVLGLGPLTNYSIDAHSTDIRKDTCLPLIRKLEDKYISIYPQGSIGSYASPKGFRLKSKRWFPKPYTITFTSTLATSGNTGLWLSMWSDSTASPSPGFVSGYLTVYYRDA